MVLSPQFEEKQILQSNTQNISLLENQQRVKKKVYYKERNAFRIHKYNDIFIHTPAAGSNQNKKVNPERHSNNGKLKGISEKLLRYNGVIVN